MSLGVFEEEKEYIGLFKLLFSKKQLQGLWGTISGSLKQVQGEVPRESAPWHVETTPLEYAGPQKRVSFGQICCFWQPKT